RLRLRQSQRQRCKTITFATASNLLALVDSQLSLRARLFFRLAARCHSFIGQSAPPGIEGNPVQNAGLLYSVGPELKQNAGSLSPATTGAGTPRDLIALPSGALNTGAGL